LVVFCSCAGALYWCPPEQKRESPQCCLPLHEITDVFVGKHTKVFSHPDAAAAVPDRCVSLVSRSHTIDLEARSTLLLSAWLHGINCILGSSGKKVVLNKTEEGQSSGAPPPDSPTTGVAPPPGSAAARHARTGSRKYSVVPATAYPAGRDYALPKSVVMKPSPTLLRELTTGQPGAASSPASLSGFNEAVRMMTNGCSFTLYDDQKSEEVFVFYAPREGPAGTLYWCAPGKRSESSERSFPLDQVGLLFHFTSSFLISVL
jgi:hypothetical protein